MRTLSILIFAGLALGLAGPASAQLLPRAPQLPGLPTVGGVAGDLLRPVDELGRDVTRTARRLAREQRGALEELVRDHPEVLEMTRDGPAVRSEIVAMDPDPALLAVIEAAGFAVIRREPVEDLGFELVTLSAPAGLPVDRAIARLRRLAPDLEVTANHLHLPSGVDSAGFTAAGTLAQRGGGGGTTIGLVDGGVAQHPALRGSIEQRGFTAGGLQPSAHGTAVASLIAGDGPVRGAAPGANLKVADIFGGARTGGSATNLVRAINWLVGGGVRVIAISLAGPNNPVVARAITEAHRRGTYIVASVGNAGPAAPASYPASYPESVAVTAVDSRGRVLIEAGRTPHLDYAAPGADMAAAHPGGGLTPVRGTSFAVPLVAGRLARHIGASDPLAALDREASARDRRYGRGLICASCRTPPPRN
ncbi:MAG: S8 family serine peptidase [Allosphingosinicella sp.]|uniref:S8 family serine peptidase n=1 Tax=Allosphingosinicella sp. TaxID=2823234 RepID=UPI003939C1B9